MHTAHSLMMVGLSTPHVDVIVTVWTLAPLSFPSVAPPGGWLAARTQHVLCVEQRQGRDLRCGPTIMEELERLMGTPLCARVRPAAAPSLEAAGVWAGAGLLARAFKVQHRKLLSAPSPPVSTHPHPCERECPQLGGWGCCPPPSLFPVHSDSRLLLRASGWLLRNIWADSG